jgi:hypothetical protein
MRLATTDQCEVDLPISTGMSSKVERQSAQALGAGSSSGR